MVEKYRSNVGKAIFLGWTTCILTLILCPFIFFIVATHWGTYLWAGVACILFQHLVWLFSALIKWKSFVLDGDTLILKRFLRFHRKFDINENLVTGVFNENSFLFWDIFAEPIIRIIDSDGKIYNIRCPYMTEKVAQRLVADVNSKQHSNKVSSNYQPSEFGGET